MIRQGDDGEGGSAHCGHDEQLSAICEDEWPMTPASFEDHVDEHAVCPDTVAVRFYWILLSRRCTRIRAPGQLLLLSFPPEFRVSQSSRLLWRVSRKNPATVGVGFERCRSR